MFPFSDQGSYSLRRRLVVIVLLAAIVVWALLGLGIYRAILRASAAEFDERLVRQARAILAYADHEYAETKSVIDTDIVAVGQPARADVVYQIWLPDGRLVYRSAGAPQHSIASLSTTGFSDVSVAGAAWRAYGMRAPLGPLVILVAEPAAHRAMIASRSLQTVLLPVLLALPLLAILVFIVTGAALRPVTRLARETSTREAGDLREFDTEQLPAEIAALATALNALLTKQREALSRESRFTADAAHELRTPLAAVRVQAQVALRVAQLGPADALPRSLATLIAGVDRADRLVTQLLSLARLERLPVAGGSTSQLLGTVIGNVASDLGQLAEAQQVQIQIEPIPDVLVPEEPLYLLIRNLVDNGLRHSPPGALVRIACRSVGADFTLSVCDRGPGIPEALRTLVLERFYRGTQSYDGSGLGLSIVARVVQLLGGRLLLADPEAGTGLCVHVCLPLPQQD